MHTSAASSGVIVQCSEATPALVQLSALPAVCQAVSVQASDKAAIVLVWDEFATVQGVELNSLAQARPHRRFLLTRFKQVHWPARLGRMHVSISWTRRTPTRHGDQLFTKMSPCSHCQVLRSLLLVLIQIVCCWRTSLAASEPWIE